MTSKKSRSISILMTCFCDRIPDGQMFCALRHKSQVIEKKRMKFWSATSNFRSRISQKIRISTYKGRPPLSQCVHSRPYTNRGRGRGPTQYKVCTSHLMGLYLRLSTFCQCQRLAIETSWCLTLECILALSALYIDFQLLVMTRLCGAVQLISCIILVPQFRFYTEYFP